MCNHDFQIGQRVYTTNDPHFQTNDIRILEGVVEGKWTSPRGDEFTYDIRQDNGTLYRNVFGINVYGSGKELHDAVMHNLEGAIEDADRWLRYYANHLELAKNDKERLQELQYEWVHGPRNRSITCKCPKCGSFHVSATKCSGLAYDNRISLYHECLDCLHKWEAVYLVTECLASRSLDEPFDALLERLNKALNANSQKETTNK